MLFFNRCLLAVINATRRGPKLATRTPYSQPGHREKMSQFICIDLEYYLRRGFYASGFHFPLASSGFWEFWCFPTPHLPGCALGVACMLAVVCQCLSPFASPWDYIIDILLYLPLAPWKLHFCLEGTILGMLVLSYHTVIMRSEESCSEHKSWL